MRQSVSVTVSAAALLASVALSHAALVTLHSEANVLVPKANDGVLSPNEYGPGNNQVYTGAGAGFGGTVGGGQTYMAADLNNWYVGFTPGNNLNDVYVIQFNVNTTGPVSAATHGDNSDGGRTASTLAGFDGPVNFPIGVSYALAIGNFGSVLFRYNTLNPSGPLDFVQYDGNAWNTTGAPGAFHEIAIPWANVGSSSLAQINWFGYYASGGAYLSNEGVPSQPLYGGPPADTAGNIGFGNGTPVTFADYNVFFVPAPGAATLLGLGALAAARRRRN